MRHILGCGVFFFISNSFFVISTWHKAVNKHVLTSLLLTVKSLLGCRFIWGLKRNKNPFDKIPSINTSDCEQTWNILGGCAKQTHLFVCLLVFSTLTKQAVRSVAADWLAQGRRSLWEQPGAESQRAGPQSSTQVYVTLFIGWQTPLHRESSSVLEGSKK